MNKCFEIAVIASVILLFLFLGKSVYGASSLAQLQSQVNADAGYRTQLIDYINKSDLYENLTWLTADQKEESRDKLNHSLPSYSLEQLEELAKGIMNGCCPLVTIADIENERLAPAVNTFSDLLKSKN